MSSQAIPSANSPRDVQGRFKTGNAGGPGNPFARQVAQLRKALLASVSAEDIQAVAGRLVELAKDGNVPAAKLLFSYTLGKPDAAPNPDRLDADEWEGYRQTAPMKAEAAPLVSAGAPEFHLEMVRTLRPLIADAMREQLAAEARAAETPEAEEPLDPAAEAASEAIHAEMNRWMADRLPELADPPSTNGPKSQGSGGRSQESGVRKEGPPSTNGSKSQESGGRSQGAGVRKEGPPSTNGHPSASARPAEPAASVVRDPAPSPNGRFHADSAA